MFRQIVVPVDSTRFARHATRRAASIARASHAALDIVLVEAELPSGFGVVPLETAEWKKDEQFVSTLAADIGEQVSVPPTHAVVRGDPAEEICKRAREFGADLIVIASHARTGVAREWKGSVADKVLRQSHVPVLMLRPPPDRIEGNQLEPFARILVPLDGSELSAEMLYPASKLARSLGAEILRLRVVPSLPVAGSVTLNPLSATPRETDEVATGLLMQDAKDDLAECVRLLRSWGIHKVRTEIVVSPDAGAAIVDATHRHATDVVAMSTHGRGASRLLVGSVADAVIRFTRIPLLLFRPSPALTDALPVGDRSVFEQLPALAGAT